MKNHNKDNKNGFEAQYKNSAGIPLLHYHFPTIDSTNTWAKLNGDKWLDKGVTLITASEQTSGRGRFKRTWISPKNQNIYASFCFLLNQLRDDVGQIPQLLAFSAAQILEEYGLIPTIKWPNDVLVEAKKIAGILCETILSDQQLGVICGIGLNVNMSLEEIVKIDQPAQSMYLVKNRLFNLEEVTEKLVKRFINNLMIFKQQGFDPFFKKFEEYSHYQIGEEIYIVDGIHQFKGKFIQLKGDGSLCLLLENGQIKMCSSGEIWDQNKPFA